MDPLDDQRESSSTLSPELGVMEYSGIASTSSAVSQVQLEHEEEDYDDDAELEPVRNEAFSCSVSETTCSCICLLTTIWFLGRFLTLHVNLYWLTTIFMA